MEIEPPPTEAPEQAGPRVQETRSPLVPEHLVDVFLHPRRFFTSQLALGRTPYVVAVTWCFGASSAIDRVNESLGSGGLASSVGSRLAGAADSWPAFWIYLALSGAGSGLLLWWFGGWWYRVRLGWCGAREPDPRVSRLVYIYSAFVGSAPAVLLVALETVVFTSYREAWMASRANLIWLQGFALWSLWPSYVGATTLFDLGRIRARIWFLVLPALAQALASGLWLEALKRL
ncbi:MAG: hypothetical protein ACE5IL_07130 [Myxococcota bacterium]